MQVRGRSYGTGLPAFKIGIADGSLYLGVTTNSGSVLVTARLSASTPVTKVFR